MPNIRQRRRLNARRRQRGRRGRQAVLAQDLHVQLHVAGMPTESFLNKNIKINLFHFNLCENIALFLLVVAALSYLYSMIKSDDYAHGIVDNVCWDETGILPSPYKRMNSDSDSGQCVTDNVISLPFFQYTIIQSLLCIFPCYVWNKWYETRFISFIDGMKSQERVQLTEIVLYFFSQKSSFRFIGLLYLICHFVSLFWSATSLLALENFNYLFGMFMTFLFCLVVASAFEIVSYIMFWIYPSNRAKLIKYHHTGLTPQDAERLCESIDNSDFLLLTLLRYNMDKNLLDAIVLELARSLN